MISFAPFICLLAVSQDPAPTVVPERVVEPSLEWARKTTGENIVSLELVSRRFASGGKPDLWLIGVAHIADSSFYNDITELLDEMDIVLYESVRPSGSRPPSGVTDEEKVASTKKSLEFVADIAKRASEETEFIPETLDDVISDAGLLDRRLSGWVEDASVDAWGRPFALQVNEDRGTITLWSFGSDGAVGGSGSAEDLTVSRVVDVPTVQDLLDEEELLEAGIFLDEEEEDLEEVESKGMQAEFADALGFEFQLEALPYEDPNWFCSDLTIDEVQSKLVERGADPALLDAITGASFTAKIATGMMKIIPMLDSLLGGGIRETARLLMIEVLSMPSSDQMLDDIEPELSHVIIVDRNTELLGDVAATLSIAEDLKTIAVLYGAGHMSDLAPRLFDLFGYVPVEERWFPTMSVDPSKSLLDEKYMRQMRVMMQIQMENTAKKNSAVEKSD
tara:strand:+ start:6810 stop:8156 length:1347 start_codon:yes stop_codon:yes gene_type:complete